ncbi:uncharacterized protein BYT42DRAFT_372440 [Radiomyces spectabilis]|uniref:uncharacterized protein n=1 Tax=Radiomyces spectabilis TaxID=64574 RepID=UPI00221E41E5|nr:uncharacterized protein BYT42DRAFT_372440 [Radiomyces spectabilis]KAI8376037.1 hypothetical protein BYT42DRAFT_372440 [Radiomyces spectabilis]
MFSSTLALGYLSVPVTVTHTMYTGDQPVHPEPWTPSTPLSIAFFVKRPPTMNRTIAKHLIKLASPTTIADTDFIHLLSGALNDAKEPIHGIVELGNDTLGILSATEQPDTLLLHIVERPPTPALPSFHRQAPTFGPSLQLDQLAARPSHILQLCQQWPAPEAANHLRMLANDTYHTATLYGYWDMWRVLEGICMRFNINPEQLITMSSSLRHSPA